MNGRKRVPVSVSVSVRNNRDTQGMGWKRIKRRSKERPLKYSKSISELK